MISIKRRVILSARPNATIPVQPTIGAIPGHELLKGPEAERKEDILFIPPDMSHSRDLDNVQEEPGPIYSLPGLSPQSAGPTDEASSRYFHTPHFKDKEIPDTARSHGFFGKRRTQQARLDEKQVIEPAILKTLVSYNDLDEGIPEEGNGEGFYIKDTSTGMRIKRRSMALDHEEMSMERKDSKEESGLKSHEFPGEMDEVTRYLISKGLLRVKDERFEGMAKEKESPHPDIANLIPNEYRGYLTKMLHPKERKKMLRDIYKTKVFIASYWMVGIFLILLLLPESRFYAPFIAGYIGGRKAGSVFKGTLAALLPFMLLGLLDLLVSHNVIYHFYDIYLPSAGTISHNLLLMLSNMGMDTTGLKGAFYDPATSLGRTCIYMAVAAVIGGTLEGDNRRLSYKTADWLKVSNITSQLKRGLS